MKKVPIFIASSIREFDREREQFSEYLDMLNDVHEADGVEIEWKRPETMSHALYNGGSQLPYNKKIKESRFFILIVGKKLGKYTEAEFDVALEQFKKTNAPVILPYFLNVRADMNALRFQERLRKELDIGEQYVDPYDNFDQILNNLHIELIRGGAFQGGAEPSDRETAARKGLDGIRELIAEQRDKIAELKAQFVTPQIIAEISAAYEEIYRLVKTYKVEPDALLDYMWFLYYQNLHDKGIKLGHWMEKFYNFAPPKEAMWARVKHRIATLYHGSKQYERSERYYREALEIWRRLAAKNPAAFEPDLAVTCSNLSELLFDMNRVEEAKKLAYEALEIWQHLSAKNSAFKLNLAWAYSYLGELLVVTNQAEKIDSREALEVFRGVDMGQSLNWANIPISLLMLLKTADKVMAKKSVSEQDIRKLAAYTDEVLDTYKHLVSNNPAALEPKLATLYQKLGTMLYSIGMLKKAENYYREALKTWRRLAAKNPATFEPDLANTCYHLGVLLKDKHWTGEAETHYREALNIYRRYSTTFEPNLAKTCYHLGDLLKDKNQTEKARRLYLEALEIYKCLTVKNPDDFEPDLANVCYNLGTLLEDENRTEKAQKFYREALKIYKRLAIGNPADFEPDVADVCHDLARLLYNTNRKKEAEQYYREVLQIYRRLAVENPADFEPNLAETCDNLAFLLYYANQIQEAETYCREALEIWRRLAAKNPTAFESDLAESCNSLSLLLIEADKMEKAVSKEQIQQAEPYLFETLDIWQRLAKEDPAEFEPCLAIISYNLGVWEYKRGNSDAARRYFDESLSLFEKFPDWEENAQQVRDALAKL